MSLCHSFDYFLECCCCCILPLNRAYNWSYEDKAFIRLFLRRIFVIVILLYMLAFVLSIGNIFINSISISKLEESSDEGLYFSNYTNSNYIVDTSMYNIDNKYVNTSIVQSISSIIYSLPFVYYANNDTHHSIQPYYENIIKNTYKYYNDKFPFVSPLNVFTSFAFLFLITIYLLIKMELSKIRNNRERLRDLPINMDDFYITQ